MSITQRHIVEPPETRMVLENVAWDIYVALAEQRRGSVPRMTYDNGVLEMMRPRREHENIGRLVGRMIETYSELRDIDIISVASVTVRRSDQTFPHAFSLQIVRDCVEWESVLSKNRSTAESGRA